MEADPFDGLFWTHDAHAAPSPWDKISRGSWVQLRHNPKIGVYGGAPLSKYSAKDQPWPENMQGFVPTMWHDMHCIVSSNEGMG